MQNTSLPAYDGTVIRPPSEADSLILQYTIGCSYNRCIFCPAYKNKRFRIRSRAEMEQEIRSVARVFGDIGRIFLADGDALAVPVPDLLALLTLLKSSFPLLRRVGMYASARTILSRSTDDLVRLRKAGLGILYLGVESGDDTLLAWMEKGVSAADIAEAGRRVQTAGIKLSVTVLLGIGGTDGSAEHARRTGRLLTTIDPDFVGALTIMVVPGTPLYELQAAGRFLLPGPFAMLRELAEMLSHTTMTRGLFFANHASNYLPIRVRMPRGRDQAVALIHEYVQAGDLSALMPEALRRL